MASKGFYLSKLSVTGEDKEPAIVDFFPGLNVITGLSDTGKSYVFSAINYMFGSQTPPEEIAEAEGYDAIWLELKMIDSHEIYTLQRGFNSKSIRLYYSDFRSISETSKFEDLKTTGSSNNKTDHISSFLLKQSGFPISVNLVMNAKGETSTFTFRVLWDFVSATEIEILKKESPVSTGRYVDETRQKNAFTYLLTGKSEEKKYRAPTIKVQVDNAHLAGQVEMCKRLIEDLTGALAALEKERKRFKDIKDLQAEIEKLSQQVDTDASKVSATLNKRNALLDELEERRDKIRAISQMQSRFDLLRQHYKSDLSRLDFISEGHFFISQLQSSMCPACGKPLTDPDHEHTSDSAANNESLQEACKQEVQKIQAHLDDLNTTFANLQTERQNLEKAALSLQKESDSLETSLQQNLRVTWGANKLKLEDLLSYQRMESDFMNTTKQITALKQTQAELTKKAREDSSDISQQTTEEDTNGEDKAFEKASGDFAAKVQKYLKQWKFSDERVSFNESTWDIQIGDKQRRSYGKGKRGVLFAAFQLALMNYCISKKLPHPRFVVLDSPLTAHRGKLAEHEEDDEYDVLPEEVQEEFFDSIARWKKDRQVIIFDNKAPAAKTHEKSNTIIFSGDSKQGRFGFFPV